jgi:hypothetical protein
MSGLEWTPAVSVYRQRWRESTGARLRAPAGEGITMTVAELIAQLEAMPPDAMAIDEDELEVITVTASPDLAFVIVWTEVK